MAKTTKKATKREPAGRQPASPQERGELLKVRATAMGYGPGVVRRRVGDVFLLDKRSQFTPTWMEWVDEETPERLTTIEEEQRKLQRERGLSTTAGRQPDPIGGDE